MSSTTPVPPQPPRYIYKIAPSTPEPLTPSSSSTDPIIPPSELDQASGYIHMSTARQIPGTLGRFFATRKGERNGVWLVKVDVQSVSAGDGDILRWEAPDGGVVKGDDEGEMFPHLYLRGGEEGKERRLWLRRDEVLDVREVVSEVGCVGWEVGLGSLGWDADGEGWLV